MKVVGREGEACAFSGEVKEITSLEAIEQLWRISQADGLPIVPILSIVKPIIPDSRGDSCEAPSASDIPSPRYTEEEET